MRSPLITPVKKLSKSGQQKKKGAGVDKNKYRSPAGRSPLCGPGYSPLITPSPRRSPRIAGISPAGFTFSPLVSDNLFVDTSVAAGSSTCHSTLSLTQRFKPATQPGGRTGRKYALFDESEVTQDEQKKPKQSRMQKLLQSDRPIPPNEPKRGLKILLRSGLREMNQLAEDLDDKASLSTNLDDPCESKTKKSISKKSSRLSIRSDNSETSKENSDPNKSVSHKVFKKIFKI